MIDEPHQPSEQPGSGDDPPGQFSQRIRHDQVSARVPEDVSRGVFSTGALVLNGPHEFIIDFLQSMSRPHQVVARIVLPTTIMQSMVRAMQQNFDNYVKRFGPLPELPTPNGGANAGEGGGTAGGAATTGSAETATPPMGGGPTAGGPEGGGGGAGSGAGGGTIGSEPANAPGEGPGEHSPHDPDQPQPPNAPKPPSVEEIYGQLKLPDEVASGTYANTVMITHSPSEFCFDFITSFYPKSTVAARIFMSAAQAPRLHATLSRSFEQFKQKVIEQQRRRKQGGQNFPEGEEPGEGGLDRG